MKTLASKVKELRKNMDLTLDALAVASDTTKSHIWEIENKPNIRPSADLVYRMAVALNTTVEALLCKEAVGSAKERDAVFMRKYQKLKPKQREQLMRIMDVI
jgi:transcriptional regulator with XRE-family HTH domain